jgi:DNA invertase Pin-like site-specific DNA recombinase
LLYCGTGGHTEVHPGDATGCYEFSSIVWVVVVYLLRGRECLDLIVTKGGAMAKYGYARVSSVDQNNDLQEARLRQAGCSIVRAEKISGGSREGRDELASLMEFMRDGDELVVLRLDRLGRNTRDVLNLVYELEAKGAALTVLEPAFSTKDAAGSMLVTVLAMVAELERRFIRERQAAGIAAAKARGVYRGRRPTVPTDKIVEMRAAGAGPSAIASSLGVSRMSVHRALRADSGKPAAV